MKRARRHQHRSGLPDQPLPCHYLRAAEMLALRRQVQGFFARRGEPPRHRWPDLHFERAK